MHLFSVITFNYCNFLIRKWNKKPVLRHEKVSARSFLCNEVMADSNQQESGTSIERRVN